MAEELRIVVVDSGGSAGSTVSGGVAGSIAPGTIRPSGVAVGAAAVAAPSLVTLSAATASIVGAAATSAVAGVGLAARAVTSQIEPLSGLSAPLAEAVAQSEVNQFLRTQRRANRLGPGLARVERSRDRLQGELFDLGTDILKALLDISEKATPIVDIATNRLDAITDVLKGDLVQQFRENSILPPVIGDILGKILTALLGGQDEEQQDAEFFQQFIGQLEGKNFWPEDQPFPADAFAPRDRDRVRGF